MSLKLNAIILFICVFALFFNVSLFADTPNMAFSMVHRIVANQDRCSVVYWDYELYSAAVSNNGISDSLIPSLTVTSVDVTDKQDYKFAVLVLKAFGSVSVTSVSLGFSEMTNPPQPTEVANPDVLPFSMKVYSVTDLSNAIYTTPSGANQTGAATGVSVLSSAQTIGQEGSWTYDPIAVMEITTHGDDAPAGTYGGTITCVVAFN